MQRLDAIQAGKKLEMNKKSKKKEKMENSLEGIIKDNMVNGANGKKKKKLDWRKKSNE